MKFKNLKLATKLNTLIITIILFSFTVIALIVLKNVEKGILSTQRQNMNTIVKQLSKNTDEIILNLSQFLEINTKREDISGNLEWKSYDLLNDSITELFGIKQYFNNVFIIDDLGKVVGTYKKDYQGTDLSEKDFFKEFKKGKKDLYITGIHKQNNRPVFMMVYPILNLEGVFIGGLTFEIDLNKFSEIYIKDKKIGEKGYFYVINQNKKVLLHPKTENIGKNDIEDIKIMSDIKKKNGFYQKKLKNEDVFISYNELERVQWYVVGKITKNDLLKLVIKLQKSMAIIVSLFLLVMILLFREINKRVIINRLSKFVEKFVKGEKGDLTVRINVDSEDEIGVLGKTFNNFMGKTETMVLGIKETSQNVLEYSNQLLDRVQKIVGATSNNEGLKNIVELQNELEIVLKKVTSQTAATEETSSTVHEITETTNLLASNTKETKDSSLEALGEAQKGGEVIEETLKGILLMKDVVENIGEKTINLDNSSKKISAILDLINSIAKQTTLLSMNAAIEASRAGEAGKGFSVVATEIKKLSEKTKGATDDIVILIKEINENIKNVVEATEKGKIEAEKNTELTEKVKGNIVRIIEKTKFSNHSVEDISVSISEQSLAMEEISTSLTEIASDSSSINLSSEEQLNGLYKIVEELSNVLKISNEISEVSEILEEMISQFKFNELKGIKQQ